MSALVPDSGLRDDANAFMDKLKAMHVSCTLAGSVRVTFKSREWHKALGRLSRFTRVSYAVATPTQAGVLVRATTEKAKTCTVVSLQTSRFFGMCRNFALQVPPDALDAFNSRIAAVLAA
jgi:hypothetical protein